MSLRGLILVLATVSVTMMAVVLVRAETARLHYALSQLDRRAAVLQQELREQQLELARLRNPAVIRAKLAEWRLQHDSGAARARSSRPGGP